MRIPFTKVYRAFSDLDRFGDAECRRYVRRALAKADWRLTTLPRVVGFSLFVGVPLTLWALDRATWMGVSIPQDPDIRILLAAIPGATLGLFGWIVSRDWALRSCLREELEAARCRKCRYSLLGVRVDYLGFGQEPGRAVARCPECGTVWNLLDIGLSPWDLTPWEARVVPEGFTTGLRRTDANAMR